MGSLAVGMLAAGLAGGCKETSDCKTACSRVAACKDNAVHGEPTMGSKRPPPDPGCMKRCESRPEEFASCEGRKRTCQELRLCRGQWQD
ncbi:MAG: hypothetical protein JRI23_23340 [Deltaproteobacteria bacterium]|jgi:hypothetical protein|nr:hypothetical protein [Deltaproteobacteria bacterium]